MQNSPFHCSAPLRKRELVGAGFLHLAGVFALQNGQLGEAGIAAVGLCGNFTLIFSVMSGAVGTVAGILIAQFLGAEEHTEAWRSLDVSLVCGGVLAALFLLAAGGFPAQILGLYTADDAILRVGAGYFRIVAFSYLPMVVSTVLSAWLRCKEHAAMPCSTQRKRSGWSCPL